MKNRSFQSLFTAVLLATGLGAANPALAAPVMTPMRSVALPDITGGDFDHFAYDLATNRLYVTAEKHRSVEVFDLKSGKHLASIGGFGNPHSINLVPDLGKLFIADGAAAAVKVLDVRTAKITGSIPTRPGPDAAFFDVKARLLYVGNGGEVEKTSDSQISVISVDTQKEIGTVPMAGNNIESMAIDRATHRLFVNLRDQKQIVVVDPRTRQVTARWPLPGLAHNTPLVFDGKTRRLFVVGRQPGLLAVVDANTGAMKSTVPCVDVSDDMTFDSKNQRLYVTGEGGLDVFDRVDRDHFRAIQHLDTKGGKTSVYVAPLHQFYVIHTKSTSGNAALDIYHVADR